MIPFLNVLILLIILCGASSASSHALVFAQSALICINCNGPSHTGIQEADVRCTHTSATNESWVCPDMPFVHNITVVCDDGATHPKHCRMFYYLKDAPTVRLDSLTHLLFNMKSFTVSRRRRSMPHIVSDNLIWSVSSLLPFGGERDLECSRSAYGGSHRAWQCTNTQKQRLGPPVRIHNYNIDCEMYDAPDASHADPSLIVAGSCRLLLRTGAPSAYNSVMSMIAVTGVLASFVVYIQLRPSMQSATKQL